ncbi:FAD/NAD(P)-binding domain-containing protein [Pilatotrama ljubarskyi]|nr:FAD/NAD(P)-binding domain-containing protein [Pilatotrama ljubarskyi]
MALDAYLSQHLLAAKITDIKLEESMHLQPEILLLPDIKATDGDSVHRALSLLMELCDLHGYEESANLPLRDDLAGIRRLDVQSEFAEQAQQVGIKPYVLIVLYEPYPPDWPIFTPRDMFADWLEQYVQKQGLVVWTRTEIVPKPVYDIDQKEWDVTLFRDGHEVKLHPAHIMFATGTLGKPNVPRIPGAECFQGECVHSSNYHGGYPYFDKRVVVIGAGNSSIDICQKLALQGATLVTMVQRSTTCVLYRDYRSASLRAAYPEDVLLPIADFKMVSMPFGLVRELSIAGAQARMDAHKDLHDKLRRGGVALNMSQEGVYVLARSQLGGLEKGGADLIAEGRIIVKSGVSPQHFTERGLVLSDGTELPAKVVILATGYIDVRQVTAGILGEDVMQQVERVYGFDGECEISGSYRPCGYPGGISRQDADDDDDLQALQIKAIQLGMLAHNGKRVSVTTG